jgi:hypothetical protein
MKPPLLSSAGTPEHTLIDFSGKGAELPDNGRGHCSDKFDNILVLVVVAPVRNPQEDLRVISALLEVGGGLLGIQRFIFE